MSAIVPDGNIVISNSYGRLLTRKPNGDVEWEPRYLDHPESQIWIKAVGDDGKFTFSSIEGDGNLACIKNPRERGTEQFKWNDADLDPW